jgi:hypothetical protein
MVTGDVRVTSSGKGIDKIKKDMEKLMRMDVLVGIPQDKSIRKTGKINNAQLLYIHTNGSELQGIPKRPVIEPAINADSNKEAITEELKKAAKLTLNGQYTEAMQQLNKTGMLGQNFSRSWFNDPRNGWAPNSAKTIEKKKSDRPLIDTGQLRKSIVYVVRENKDD